MRFDPSGKTHEFGMFNPQALSGIALNLLTVFIFVLVTFLSRQPIVVRPIHYASLLWAALLFLFTTATVLEPSFRLTNTRATDIMASLYGLVSSVVGFLLFLSLYSRQPYLSTLTFVEGLISRICWIKILTVWLVLPFAPSFVYAGDEGGPRRLGGLLTEPVGLGILAGVACMHAIVFLKGTRRALAVGLAVLTLGLSYARGPEVTFAISLLIYSIFFARALPRLIGILVSMLAMTFGLVFSSSIVNYAGRGNGIQNVLTLSDRLPVWIASMEAISERPFIGYGFGAGVKHALKDHWPYEHWIPPHAHNDLIQIVLCGGIFAGLIWIAIMFLVYRAAFRMVRVDRRYAFFLFTVVQLCSLCLLTPLISGGFGILTAIFVFCFVLLLDHAKEQTRRRPTLPLARDEPVSSFGRQVPDGARL